jgi:hypothetical protein
MKKIGEKRRLRVTLHVCRAQEVTSAERITAKDTIKIHWQCIMVINRISNFITRKLTAVSVHTEDSKEGFTE